MAKRTALVILAICSVTAPVCLLIGGKIPSLIFGLAGIGFIPSLIAIGASRNGRLGGLAAWIALLAALLLGTFLVIFFRGTTYSTLVMLLGFWLVPLILVSLVFARHYGRE